MKRRLVIFFLLLAPAALSQQNSNPNIQDGAVEITPWVGGGTGVGASSDFKFFETGVRVGKVITSEIGTGRFRWRFEYAGDIMPVYLVELRQGGWVYGGGFNPVVLKFVFTANRKITPFVEANGGVLLSTRDVPEPNTNALNFMSGVQGGFHYFIKEKRAITFSTQVIHISNASLGNHNPGINASVHFRLGYTFFK
jgi:lipid A 3-O-deacylase